METIKLDIPSKKEYISTIRLLTSSIAGKIGFDVEEVEDLRVAVSEAANMAETEEKLKIEFRITEEKIEIFVTNNEKNINYKNKETLKFSKQILETMVDKVEFNEENIIFSKNRSM